MGARRAGVRVMLAAAGLAAATAVPIVPVPTATASRPMTSTAAQRYHWGTPSWRDEFTGHRLRGSWGVFDSAGNGGNGLRRPSQVHVGHGVLTETGTADALTGGIAQAQHAASYGRWETRLRATRSGPGTAYHVVVALIPAGDVDYHCGATDLDYAEFDIGKPIGFFLHALPARQHYVFATRNTARWHTVAVEVTPSHVSWFVDGRLRMTDRDGSMVSGLPLEMNVQLDANQSSGLAPSRLSVDWTRYYPLRGDAPARPARAPGTTTYDFAC